MNRLGLLPLIIGLAGCQGALTYLAVKCDITTTSVDPSAAYVGDQVRVSATPLTSSFDTAVYVGGDRALLVDLVRENCEVCDECKSDNDCNECGDCDDCDAACADTCDEYVLFEVPAREPGPTVVQIYNAHGESQTIEFEVLAAPDTGGDSGSSDSGSTDSGGGGTDSGGSGSDSGGSDSGSSDSGGGADSGAAVDSGGGDGT